MRELFSSSKINFLKLIIIILLQINSINSSCSNGDKITNTDCFNNLTIINNYYRAGQFVTDKKGNMFILYSNDEDGKTEYRLFYGLKKDGRNFFENDNAHKIIQTDSSEGVSARYESKMILVSLESDTNQNKQYLFSTSAYEESITELYEIGEDNINKAVRKTISFWNIIDIFSFQYSLIKIPNQNIYICAFTQHENYKVQVPKDGKLVYEDHSQTFTIVKFGLTSFDLSNYHELKRIDNKNNFNDRIISSFLMEQDEILVTLYMKRADNTNQTAKYSMIFYDYDLNEKNEVVISTNNVEDPRPGDGVFFKGLYLKGKYAAFIYFTKGYTNENGSTKIKFTISILGESSGQYSFSNTIDKETTFSFISDIILNEFIKINDKRLAFISTKVKEKIGDNEIFELEILLYDLYDNYNKVKIRHYYFGLDIYQLRKELTAYVFNGFLVFSSTAVTPRSYTESNYISLLVFFGYPNGTDHPIDISPYLMDTGFYENDNIYAYLKSQMVIENNIFGYEAVDKINLVSIPPELLFYNVTDGVKDDNPLPNNTFFGQDHKLFQNFNLIKTFKDYYLDYQYIVKEPDYDTFYANQATDSDSDYNAYDEYSKKTFYGRTNRIRFKLCYQYCETCLEFGKVINAQRCSTCLEDYSYDYWTYLGRFFGNCVEINKYYDKDNNETISCDDDTFKYLIDHKTNKKICFKDNDNCPDEYANYDPSKKECEYIPPPNCTFDAYYNKICTFENQSDSDIIGELRRIIPSYQANKSIYIDLPDGTGAEITNDEKEKQLQKDTKLPWIDLAKCGEKIKAQLRNNSREPLIILKYGLVSNMTYEEYLQYEVYDPDTKEKINLTICKDIDINIVIEVRISDDFANALKNIIDQGYNPFDMNDKFYREICTPYDSENGTDVLLDAREEYYYSSSREIVCPDTCNTSEFNLDSKYLKCECPSDDNDITLNLRHISGENVGNSFYSTLKNSNWKVMICYNLVFNFKIFVHNYGSILSLILFLIYIGFIVYYAIRKIEPLQIIISKILFKDNKEEEKEVSTANNNTIKKDKGKNKDKKVIFYKAPPKKAHSRKDVIKDKDSTGITIIKDSDNTKMVPFAGTKRKREKLMTNPAKTKKDMFKSKFKKDLLFTEGANLNKKKGKGKDKEKKENEEFLDEEEYANMDNFQLNNLSYIEACRYDKRPFLKIYWSVLMREHILLFTFLSRNDYNLFYIKIERFLVLLCTQMAMNGLFFSDESMNKANKSDDYNFVQQLPKIIFSLIATHIIEVLLCYLSMTDIAIYKIKELSKSKRNEEQIVDTIKCMKRKLVGFFIATFLLFLFYWYFISAFCAVYQNTQKTFLLDSLIGIIMQFIDPFFIYGLKIILRHVSMTKCSDQKCGCVYKTSDLIPIF